MKRLLLPFLIMVLWSVSPLLAGETVETAPSSPYARFIIYQTLVIFWLAIIGLVVIIRMKLKEIRRIREMGFGTRQNGTPFLD